MKTKLLLLVCCIFVTLLLVGCGAQGLGAGFFSSSGNSDEGGTGDGTNPVGSHQPEPATISLVGAGLFAVYALSRRRKK